VATYSHTAKYHPLKLFQRVRGLPLLRNQRRNGLPSGNSLTRETTMLVTPKARDEARAYVF